VSGRAGCVLENFLEYSAEPAQNVIDLVVEKRWGVCRIEDEIRSEKVKGICG
jgi:hypothetical protein